MESRTYSIIKSSKNKNDDGIPPLFHHQVHQKVKMMMEFRPYFIIKSSKNENDDGIPPLFHHQILKK
ncbi:hypothetical protein D3H55_08930 [Bacillus salacetis]|uniref:Uncharacterized protein n=1 Tax=Bacillus salacetis TaxID=2315464 RepID=A0A3A1QZV3_9BACI|nr:hypothetical protein [Bacillus salacetis]RIW34628.1 hypothetical protein D3H55_08930 [Bacillus salacetis]